MAGKKKIRYNGKVYSFPADVTDDEITHITLGTPFQELRKEVIDAGSKALAPILNTKIPWTRDSVIVDDSSTVNDLLQGVVDFLGLGQVSRSMQKQYTNPEYEPSLMEGINMGVAFALASMPYEKVGANGIKGVLKGVRGLLGHKAEKASASTLEEILSKVEATKQVKPLDAPNSPAESIISDDEIDAAVASAEKAPTSTTLHISPEPSELITKDTNRLIPDRPMPTRKETERKIASWFSPMERRMAAKFNESSRNIPGWQQKELVRNVEEDFKVQDKAQALLDERVAVNPKGLTDKARKWFGDGILTTSDGNMRVLWRGSHNGPKEGEVFAYVGEQPKEIGIHVGTFNTAKQFAGISPAETGVPERVLVQLGEDGVPVGVVKNKHGDVTLGYLYPHVTNIKSPLEMKDVQGWSVERLISHLVNVYPSDKPYFLEMAKRMSDDVATEEIRRLQGRLGHVAQKGIRKIQSEYFKRLQKYLEDKGYDSIMYINEVEGPGDPSFIIFHNEQIKSVAAKEFNSKDKNWLNALTIGGTGGGTALQLESDEDAEDRD